jgi:DNA processing protein
MNTEDLFFQIALKQCPRVGDVTAKALLAHFGTAKAVFEASSLDLAALAAVHRDMLAPLLSKESFATAEKEVKFIERQKIQTFAFGQEGYPKRLLSYDDAPFLLFFQGEVAALQALRTVAVIGTRRPTDYGLQHCERLIEEIAPFSPLIVSGLAFGLDICAHRKSLQIGLPTIAVVAHGLDRIYPHEHSKTAEQMQAAGGGILTEFMSGTRPNRENFPMRNRIIAALSDALIVAESAEKGGSIITAELANAYKKDVFAVPGRLGDAYSAGCNLLISQHKATLLQQGQQLGEILRWTGSQRRMPKNQGQTLLFAQLNEDERNIANALAAVEKCHLDTLIQNAGLSTSRLAACLLELEFKGLVRALAGKNYQLIR